MKPLISTIQHYDLLAEKTHFFHDSPATLQYMARWDGTVFFDLLVDIQTKDILEVGIGNGRIARQILTNGCRTLTGLDISPKTLAATKSELAEFENLDLILTDISAFHQQDRFDIVYSVLTFMHIQDKMKALQNIVNALHPWGYMVLSIDKASQWLDFGEWCVHLYPWAAERYSHSLKDIGCEVTAVVPLIDMWVGANGKTFETYGKAIATLIKAVKT